MAHTEKAASAPRRESLCVNAGDSGSAGAVCVGKGDLGRLWLLLFYVIVHTMCNRVMFSVVQRVSVSPLPPSPASLGFGCCIYVLFIHWCINLGFIREDKAEQSGFSVHVTQPKKAGLALHTRQQIKITPLTIKQVYFYHRCGPCSE